MRLPEWQPAATPCSTAVLARPPPAKSRMDESRPSCCSSNSPLALILAQRLDSGQEMCWARTCPACRVADKLLGVEVNSGSPPWYRGPHDPSGYPIGGAEDF